jgi:UDP:flavonoid glycosyltransferase YjiC (YdhE family)
LSPKVLVESVETCLENPSIREKSIKVREISKRYDGVDGVVRIIQSYL